LVLALAGGASAEVIGFIDNPQGNSADWRNKIAELGGTVNDDVNFDAHPTGAIINNFYADLGVIITGTGSISNVVNGEGPGEIGTRNPRSSGEGRHPASNYVLAKNFPGTFMVTFDQPVIGTGMFLIDLFNPDGIHPVKLEVFTGPFGTGDFLGSYNAAPFNFQKNFLYFMGVVSTDGDIGSIRITVTGDIFGDDKIGLDDVLFAFSPRECTGNENIKIAKGKTKCKNGVIKKQSILIKLVNGTPLDTFNIEVSIGQNTLSENGRINSKGIAKAKFKSKGCHDFSPGEFTATATWGCGATAGKDGTVPEDCPCP